MTAFVSYPDDTTTLESSQQEPHEQTPLLGSNRDKVTTVASAGHITSQPTWSNPPTPASEDVTSVSESTSGEEDRKLGTDIVGVISVLLLGTYSTYLISSPKILYPTREKTHLHTTDPGTGVFIANADGSIVLATYGTISSELGSMENASWLVLTYSLAVCAIQPTVGLREQRRRLQPGS